MSSSLRASQRVATCDSQFFCILTLFCRCVQWPATAPRVAAAVACAAAAEEEAAGEAGEAAR